MKTIKTIVDAEHYLYGFIPIGHNSKFPGSRGLGRTKYLLELLGSPQNRLKIIHVAGTSGKGSTATYISHILFSLDKTTGLSLSPHLLDLRERFQINNQLISEKLFLHTLSEIVPSIDKVTRSEWGTPTYFEVIIAFAYHLFSKMDVDYAIMETGLGGLFDATNVVERPDKVSVISRIGHDHTEILGKTLDKIATQKAGIIYPHSEVITIKQHPRAMRAIMTAVRTQSAKLYLADTRVSAVSSTPLPHFTWLDSNKNPLRIQLGMKGLFQVENSCLALCVTELLTTRDHFRFNQKRVINAIKRCIFDGRMQTIKTDRHTFILDGAHNPQKMQGLLRSLASYYPGMQFTFILAFKRGKDFHKMIRLIIPFSRKIILTQFSDQTKSQGMHLLSEEPLRLASDLRSQHYLSYTVTRSSTDALRVATHSPDPHCVVTGSLYLLSEVYPILTHLSSPTDA